MFAVFYSPVLVPVQCAHCRYRILLFADWKLFLLLTAYCIIHDEQHSSFQMCSWFWVDQKSWLRVRRLLPAIISWQLIAHYFWNDIHFSDRCSYNKNYQTNNNKSQQQCFYQFQDSLCPCLPPWTGGGMFVLIAVIGIILTYGAIGVLEETLNLIQTGRLMCGHFYNKLDWLR